MDIFVVGNIDFKPRAAREGTGKTKYIDGNTTYENRKEENGL